MAFYVALAAVVFLALAAVLGWMVFQARRLARSLERQKHLARVFGDVEKAGLARDRLVADPGYRRRVRGRFTRS